MLNEPVGQESGRTVLHMTDRISHVAPERAEAPGRTAPEDGDTAAAEVRHDFIDPQIAADRPELNLVGGFDGMDMGPVEEQWQERALCAQTDPEAFFPEKGGSTREAKRICQSCDVRSECLDYALEHDERFGIWGGLSERERRRLKKGIV